MYEKKDFSPVKATDLLVFGQISFIFVGLMAAERRKIEPDNYTMETNTWAFDFFYKVWTPL